MQYREKNWDIGSVAISWNYMLKPFFIQSIILF